MKIVVLEGGLGNQLFQLNKCIVDIENGSKVVFVSINEVFDVKRPIEIDRYFQDLHIIDLPKIFQYILYLIVRLLSKIFGTNEFAGKHIQYGYHQNEKIAIELMRSRMSYRNSHQGEIAVHIRRTDYLKNDANREKYCVIDYEKLLNDILIKYPTSNIDVYSDDIDWVKSLKISDRIRPCVSEDDFIAFMGYRILYISNSTYSLWAGILGHGINEIYVPQFWQYNIYTNNLNWFESDKRFNIFI